jgi:pimeloyl-ACP methyl ester carboxylesterase
MLSNLFRLCIILAVLLSSVTQAEISSHCQPIHLKSSMDGTSRYFVQCLTRQQKAPLLIYRPSWSGGFPYWDSVVDDAAKKNWHVIAPLGRGANDTIDAIGSDLAIQDVIDAINYNKSLGIVDAARVYILGVSGGQMALMLAAKHPDIFAGVSVWAAMTDLTAWHAETTEAKSVYAREMEHAFGGTPDIPSAASYYRQRSPIFLADALRAVNLDLNAGIIDGHHGSVPITHSLRMFDAIATNPNHRLSPELTNALAENKKKDIPKVKNDPLYRNKPVLFRRTSGKVRLTIFDGVHEMIPTAALSWLNSQSIK